jgi:hypothetical protein
MNDPTNRPIQVVIRDRGLERERALVFFRVLLLIPHLAWLALWGIVIVLGLPVLWVAALTTGTPPVGMHRFYTAYVRYYARVWAYGTYATDVFPQFDTKADYPVDIEIAPADRQSRWSILFRLFLFLPPWLLSLALAGGNVSIGTITRSGDSSLDSGVSGGIGVLTVIWFLGWFACMAKGRMPQGMRDLAVYAIGYAAQVWGYLFLLTARFPDSTPALSRPLPQPPHPVRAELEDDLRRTRLTVLFRALLFLPHLVWLVLWGIAVFFAVIANWFVTLIAGRSPAALHRFLAAYVRYYAHVSAFVSLVANPFPGFVGAVDSYPFIVRIDPRERQNRWITGFRVILAIPMILLSSAISAAATIALVGAWIFSLIMGRVPRGLRDLNAFNVRYTAQYWSYLLLLTDRYPYSGPTLETASVDDAVMPDPPASSSAWGAPSPLEPPTWPGVSEWLPPRAPDPTDR